MPPIQQKIDKPSPQRSKPLLLGQLALPRYDRRKEKPHVINNNSEPPGFSDLSKAEQVQYLMTLWDRIVETPGEIPVPESHLELAQSRLRDYRNDPSDAHSSFEVLDRLAKSPK